MTITPATTTATAKHKSVQSLGANDFSAPEGSRSVRDHEIRLMGIGGTGVVTTSQIIATAALLAGRHVRSLDQTGLAQKGGAVVSDVKVSSQPIHASNKIGSGRPGPSRQRPRVLGGSPSSGADYQNAAYARRYEDLVEAVRAAEAGVGLKSFALTEAVARHHFKLLAYKDEYEVSRLDLSMPPSSPAARSQTCRW